LKLAKRRGLWSGDLAALLPSGFAPEYEPRTRHLSRKELYDLLEQLNPDRAARVAFIVATSAHWNETERARREHVAADLSTVFIDGTKRTSRRRTVPVVSAEQRTLLAYALEYAQGIDGALFTAWANVSRDLKLACEAARTPRCSPNDLRRTCATWLHAAGATPDLIAPVMGHVDMPMVERVYSRLRVEDLRLRLRELDGRRDRTQQTLWTPEHARHPRKIAIFRWALRELSLGHIFPAANSSFAARNPSILSLKPRPALQHCRPAHATGSFRVEPTSEPSDRIASPFPGRRLFRWG
jgi:hypothetical protein